MSDQSKTISLIQKLLTLSKDGGATEAEAALAAEKAQQLMLEHNLTFATVEQTGKTGDDGARVKKGLDKRQVYNWQKSLMGSIAELNFCHVMLRYEERGSIYGARTKVFNGYQLIGRAANVASTTVMFEYLVTTIDRLTKEHVQDPARYFTKYAHSFREGCSDRIIERLQDRQEALLKEQERKAKEEEMRRAHPAYAGSNLPAIILRDFVEDEKELNEDLLHGLPPGTTKARRLKLEQERAETKARRDARYNELIAAGDSHEIAYCIAAGFTRERALGLTAPSEPTKPETEAQRQKRLSKERRYQDQQQEQRWRQQQREARRLDGAGYSAGVQTGDKVGLDQQVGENQNKRIK